MFVLKAIVGASDIPMHHTLLSCSFLTKTRSRSKSPDFQSLRSPSSIVMRVAIRQQSSVLSVNRIWRYRKPSSNLWPTESTTFPCKPRYRRPGATLRRSWLAGFCLFMEAVLLSLQIEREEVGQQSADDRIEGAGRKGMY